MLAFVFGIFVSAFLLFQVQPVIARYILPWFGGSPAVWTTCMLFFQVGLLAGYYYAHLLATRVARQRQAIVHGGLLLLSLALLPITPSSEWIPSGGENPAFKILTLLFVAVGLPFAILSASAPLLQRWYAESFPGESPFRLYALSNLGALLALLSYPFIVEPRLPLDEQIDYWSYGYGLFVCLIVVCGFIHMRATSGITAAAVASIKTSRPSRLIWIGLSACGSVVLLATTNQMCQDVAVIPFLWVLPLSLYLVSFIICFENDRWYHRGVWLPFLLVSVAAVVYLLNQAYADTEPSLLWQIIIYSSAMFACCMVCHGELVRRRPVVGELTHFYLYVAVGGALGGICVNLIAPLVFDGFWELHGGLLIVVIVGGLFAWSDKTEFPLFLPRSVFGMAWTVTAMLMTYYLGVHIKSERELSILNDRGFYGVLHVYDQNPGTNAHQRSFYNGRISHGSQLFAPEYRATPGSYYGIDSGIAQAFQQHPNRRQPPGQRRPLKIGVIGLGAGAVSVYARRQDTLRFYELNPQVETIARKYFTYLEDHGEKLDVVIGDARVSLERELEETGSAGFDVLILDAFSGDSIPMHLLTSEAFDLYWQHLREDGILAAHITNFHLDLSDVVRQMAARFKKSAILFEDPATRPYEFTNEWVLVTSNKKFMQAPGIRENKYSFSRPVPRDIVWTDNFSNLFEVVYW